jgi:hypothetical protein
MRHPAAALLFATFLATGATACRPDFAPFNRLTALRVLGIQSEPPTPLTGETTALSALIFTPTPDPTLTYQWSWCPVAAPAANGFGCLITEAELDAYLATANQAPVPPFDLGSGETAVLANTIPAPVLLAACNGGLPNAPSSVKIDCSGGFPAQVTLTVTTATDTVTAVQNVKLRFDPTTQVNTNPSIDGLSIAQGGVQQPVDDLGTIVMPRGVETPIATSVAETAAEAYDDGTCPAGQPPCLTERLFTTWFVETGDTHDQRTSFISGSTSFPDLLTNTWTPGATKDYPGTTARIYTVLHDNRDGVSWRSGTVTLEAGP